MPLLRDDLDHPVEIDHPVTSVVSLVPSLTEGIALSRREALVAATQWCTFPPELDVRRVRGTKNPDTKAIIALGPDLVIANQEENRELDVRRLRDAGIRVWVTRIRSVDEAITSMRRLFDDALGWGIPEWLAEADRVWSAPPVMDRLRVAAVVWKEPWMVVGSQTFAGDVLARMGFRNAFDDHPDRYPTVAVEDLDAMGLDVVLLPDEPYAFSPTDGPSSFAQTPVALIDGRMLTWYGPSLVPARAHLEESIRNRSLHIPPAGTPSGQPAT